LTTMGILMLGKKGSFCSSTFSSSLFSYRSATRNTISNYSTVLSKRHTFRTTAVRSNFKTVSDGEIGAISELFHPRQRRFLHHISSNDKHNKSKQVEVKELFVISPTWSIRSFSSDVYDGVDEEDQNRSCRYDINLEVLSRRCLIDLSFFKCIKSQSTPLNSNSMKNTEVVRRTSRDNDDKNHYSEYERLKIEVERMMRYVNIIANETSHSAETTINNSQTKKAKSIKKEEAGGISKNMKEGSIASMTKERRKRHPASILSTIRTKDEENKDWFGDAHTNGDSTVAVDVMGTLNLKEIGNREDFAIGNGIDGNRAEKVDIIPSFDNNKDDFNEGVELGEKLNKMGEWYFEVVTVSNGD